MAGRDLARAVVALFEMDLHAAIEGELESQQTSALARAATDLTEAYKSGDFSRVFRSPAHRAAYLAVRMPATFAACEHVFSKAVEKSQIDNPVSLLDFGSGPGTAMWAAADHLPIVKVTCVERDAQLIEAGRRLTDQATHAAIRSATWLQADITRGLAVEPHDIVVISYALGEVARPADLIARAWSLARQWLVIIEPGTPRNFAVIHEARTQLLAAGAHMVAPCPHHERCPMFATGDWCHFAARLARTSLHRRIKGGDLGYEDEKFSYMVASRTPVALPSSRVLRHPLVHPGHVKFTLCRPERPESRIVTKSQKELYRTAKKLKWGDAWEF